MTTQSVRKPVRHLLTTHDFHKMGEVGITLDRIAPDLRETPRQGHFTLAGL